MRWNIIMAKAKKRGLSDKVRNKKKNTTEKVNPFEVKFNRQKHNVLGRKISKHDKGMPGLSRSKAIKKRKETLLVEYKKRGKVNKFVDKRIGENDPELPIEEKMLKRFAVERQRTHEKGELFKLNEEEDLTHYGQSLSQIEKFEDTVPSESDDEDDRGKIAAKMVAEEHFGGFLTKRSDEGDEGPKKSWKERMEEIITKSKREKYERQHEKEKQLEETEKLDKEWKDLQSAVTASMKKGKEDTSDKMLQKGKEDTSAKNKVDDYDIMVRELQFELKGKPSDRLKSEEEQAQYEVERLQKLEEDRVRRMEGAVPGGAEQTHKSADDLDDGFDLDRPGKAVRFEVKYKDGKMITEDDEEKGDTSSESEGQEDKETSDYDGDNDGQENSDGESGEENSNSDPEEDRMSDIQSSAEEDEAEDADETQKLVSKVGQGILKKKLREISLEDTEKQKKAMEEAKKELPYTFPAPESYEDLLTLLEDHSEEDQLTIIERVRKCHHPSLAEGNKEKLQTLLGFLVQYYCDMAVQNPPQLKFMNRLVKHVYELTQQSPMAAGKAIQEAVKDQEDMFCQYCEVRNGRGIFPTLDTLMLLKLVSVLFPTSDFCHPVVTPASLFLSQIITRCSINTTRDVASGLFICTLFTEFVSFSKRFVPEVINFLHGILFLACEKTPGQIEPVVHPFKPVGKSIDILKLQKESRDIKMEPLKLGQLFSMGGRKHLDSDVFKVQAIGHCMSLLTSLAKLYSHLPSVAEVYQPIKCLCEKIPMEKYPSEVQELQEELLEQCVILSEKAKQKSLTMPRQIPQPLKQFEPKVEESFDGKKKRGGTREFNEKQRDLHKYKKELAGARKEIVKDMKFVHDQKLKEQLDRDEERKRKVKQIYHDLANQEGDYKALKRKKDNMK